MGQWSEKCVVEGSKYGHWIGLYLSFILSWYWAHLYGRLQNLQTSEDRSGRSDLTLILTHQPIIMPVFRLFSASFLVDTGFRF